MNLVIFQILEVHYLTQFWRWTLRKSLIFSKKKWKSSLGSMINRSSVENYPYIRPRGSRGSFKRVSERIFEKSPKKVPFITIFLIFHWFLGTFLRFPFICQDRELCTRTSRVQNSAASAASGSSYTRVGAKLVIFSRIYEEKIKFPSDRNS